MRHRGHGLTDCDTLQFRDLETFRLYWFSLSAWQRTVCVLLQRIREYIDSQLLTKRTWIFFFDTAVRKSGTLGSRFLTQLRQRKRCLAPFRSTGCVSLQPIAAGFEVSC
jgi:hypothetical protein